MANRSSFISITDFVGCEVVSNFKERSFIYKVDACHIYIEVCTSPYHSHYRYETGTGFKDNAVTRGTIKFLEPCVNRLFIEVYENYVHSDSGKTEAFIIDFNRYD